MPSKSAFIADKGASPRPPTSAPASSTVPPSSSGAVTSSPTGAAGDPVSVTVTSPPKYSTASPEHYRYARQTLADMWGISRISDLTFRVNGLAEDWFHKYGRWPTGRDLVGWDVTYNSMWSFANGYSGLDPLFTIYDPATQTQTTYRNDPVRGVSAIGPLHPAFAETVNEQGVPDGIVRGPFAAYDVNQLPSILASMSPISGSVGGSGGGGGGGRAALAFDRRQLAEEATNRWRGLLLEEPDEDTLNSLVNDYISEANAFWMKEAGRLDYDTFVVDRVRSTNRHTFLYDKKPEFQSEAEYMGGFRQTVGQFGLGDRAALRETEAGAHSGAGLAGFGERVGRTSEARLASSGSYSQRFAASMAQTGIGRT